MATPKLATLVLEVPENIRTPPWDITTTSYFCKFFALMYGPHLTIVMMWAKNQMKCRHSCDLIAILSVISC